MSRIPGPNTHRCFRPDHNLARIINAGREKAEDKHGEMSVEAAPATDTAFWLACLTEETGEVGRALTYDHFREDGWQGVADEILDAMTVLGAWYDAMRAEDLIDPPSGVWLA